MNQHAREATLWLSPGHRPDSCLAELAKLARTMGGDRALSQWLKDRPSSRAAYVHGERHNLWWEFRLVDSFHWQGHVWRMRPAQLRQRISRLSAQFRLTHLLERPVAELTRVERALADLAVALLPGPELLVWEEPVTHMTAAERDQMARIASELCHLESITVLIVAAEPDGLLGLGAPVLPRRAAY